MTARKQTVKELYFNYQNISSLACFLIMKALLVKILSCDSSECVQAQIKHSLIISNGIGLSVITRRICSF